MFAPWACNSIGCGWTSLHPCLLLCMAECPPDGRSRVAQRVTEPGFAKACMALRHASAVDLGHCAHLGLRMSSMPLDCSEYPPVPCPPCQLDRGSRLILGVSARLSSARSARRIRSPAPRTVDLHSTRHCLVLVPCTSTPQPALVFYSQGTAFSSKVITTTDSLM